MAARRMAPVRILHIVRFFRWLCAPRHGFLKSLIGVFHLQRDVPHAVAMLADVLAAGWSGVERRRET